MRYQKEFEEYFFKDTLHHKPLKVTDNGVYYNGDIAAQYKAFVAGIESGIKMKEPTLLEQVKEWRNSNISDEELLNNISLELNKETSNFKPMVNEDYLKYKLVDLKYHTGFIAHNVLSKIVPYYVSYIAGWMPSADQD